MRVRKKYVTFFSAAVFCLAVFAGCNIFGFATDEEKTPLEKAEDAIRSGDYDRAIKELTDENGALKDSTDSMILYTYSKAVLLKSGLTTQEMIDLIQSDESRSGTGNLAFLEQIDKQSNATKTAWYQANVEMSQILNRIRSGEVTGQMSKEDIALDYSIANIMSGVMSLRDTNRDNIIDDRDFQFRLTDIARFIHENNVVFGFNGITARDSHGNVVTYPGLTAFLGTPVSGKRAKHAGISGYTPDDINPIIATFLEYLGQGEESIRYCIETLTGDTSYDLEAIMAYIPQVAKIINFYWYDDNMDDDGDGRIDEEIIDGIDNDSDGLVDEDSDFIAAYDFTNTVNTYYVPLWEEWKRKFE